MAGKRGRPKKHPNDIRKQDLRIPVTKGEKQLIQEAASLKGMDMAGWARIVLWDAAVKVVAPSEYD